MQFITLNIIASCHLSLSSNFSCVKIDVSLEISSEVFTISLPSINNY